MANNTPKRTCVECDGTLENVCRTWTGKVRHDHTLHGIVVESCPMLECAQCGAQYHNNDTADAISAQVRRVRGLLTPAQIHQYRTAAKLSQAQLAEMISSSQESIARWESGARIQSTRIDQLLRKEFGLGVQRRFPTSKKPATQLPRFDPDSLRAGHVTLSGWSDKAWLQVRQAEGPNSKCLFAVAA